MLSPLLHSRLSRPFRQIGLRCFPSLNLWSLTKCIHTLRGEKMLATSTDKTSQRGSNTSSRLRTLRPERLSIVGQEVIDLSGKSEPLVPTITDELPLQCIYERGYLRNNTVKYTPFPPNTRGVFYFDNARGMPELGAGVRFRICDSAAEFERGRDLLDPRGDVWGPKILELVKQKGQEGLLSLLRAENLISEGLINDINKLDITKNVRKYQISLFDPFYLNLAQSHRHIKYVTRSKLIRLAFPPKMFMDRVNRSTMYPMTGSIKVRFELSDLPIHKVLGPTLVIRVLDIAEPIAVNPLYGGDKVPVPVPGTLLYRLISRRKLWKKEEIVGRKTILFIPLKQQPMADDLLTLMKTS